ncbi:retron Ec67 family RNA-directed DNA polymerase/endonuclease [Comamonas terrigena]|uniref:retron Ec67 family RNA-directed DNA polymerase/endonuclease n=1 Tax=Comamonas terrigena TaxID=32013 RepID=UPI00244C30B1|nr:retron Ec67 family RNA-directed DNA polymerase/endonuclease [Comamonas terrigena]MDH1700562.1 retron Ec67 family RNA-directed DNA polymerase/endonuclease [Comamonas terrigena]
MKNIDKLKSCENLKDLANLLGYETKIFSWIIYKDTKNYTSFKIRKKSGGHRIIEKPYPKLKLIQQKLSALFYNCIDELDAKKFDPSHGYKKKRSIITNASKHKNKKILINIDLKEFFPSINFGRVYGYLIKNKNFNLNPEVAKVIAKIATTENGLPQGSPLSPIISNLIAENLDYHLTKFSKSIHCTYTRYVDDLSFSSNDKKIESIFLNTLNGEIHASLEFTRIIQNCGFEINHKKTRISRKEDRQEVTGIVVNKRINVQNDYRKYVRAMVHNYITIGNFHIPDPIKNRILNKYSKKESPTKILQGMLGYIDHIDLYSEYLEKSQYQNFGSFSEFKTIKTRQITEKNSSQEKIYRNFLIYDWLYTTKSTVLICEGKTDPVHIKCALNSLSNNFPNLIKFDDAGYYQEPAFRIIGCDEKRTLSLLKLTGGTDNLGNFSREYKKSLPYKNYITNNKITDVKPVIILMDNDDGLKKFTSKITNIEKEDVQNNVTHIQGNLYYIVLDKQGSIEDLYDPSVLLEEIDGRKFNKSNTSFDKEIYYGKVDFAEKIIKENLSNINFSRFMEIFQKIQSCETHFQKNITKILNNFIK